MRFCCGFLSPGLIGVAGMKHPIRCIAANATVVMLSPVGLGIGGILKAMSAKCNDGISTMLWRILHVCLMPCPMAANPLMLG